MTNGSKPAMPCNYVVSPLGNVFNSVDDKLGGLTIREHFAESAVVDFEDWAVGAICGALGYETSYYAELNESGKFLFWIEAEAKFKVMKADALITELNKKQ